MGIHNENEAESHTHPPFPPPPFLPPGPLKKKLKDDDISKSDERRLKGLPPHSMEKQMNHDRSHERNHERDRDRDWDREHDSGEKYGNYEPIWQYKLQHPMSGEPSSSSGHGQPGQDPRFRPYSDEFLNQQQQQSSNKTAMYLGIFIPIFIAFLLLICFFCWYRRRRLIKFKKRALAANEISIIGNHYLDSDNLKPKKPTDPWEIKRENVVVHYERKLGSGAFADVYVGEVIGDTGIKKVYNDVLMLSNFHDCEVAVKMLPPFADETSKNDFQKEINFMKSLKYHPHLVCLMGYAPDAVSPLLLIEFCAHGDLLHFVRDHKNQLVHGNEAQNNLKVKNLVSFSWQISNGLEYLSSIGIVHRDVAARNVLLDKNNVCKIGDFGLCRIADSQIYTTRGGKLPVRWMSIESLKSFEFSIKTDVWSYGILLFELFSFGEVPYAGLENSQILEYLESSKRLHKPAYCTEDIYEIMINCWKFSPSERRSFAEICLQLMRILENANSDYGYVEAIDGTEIQIIDSVDDTGQSVV